MTIIQALCSKQLVVLGSLYLSQGKEVRFSNLGTPENYDYYRLLEWKPEQKHITSLEYTNALSRR